MLCFVTFAQELFQLLQTDTLLPSDVTTTMALYIELAAGRLSTTDSATILSKLSRPSAGYIHFLDYLMYIPFFIKVHQTIIDNPLYDFTQMSATTSKEGNQGGNRK
uniref:Uncharacterized protein n=1 Tax=Octopus bimaculoides TaxID=37653 RepID=A0A0L8HIQ1_OCTBM